MSLPTDDLGQTFSPRDNGIWDVLINDKGPIYVYTDEVWPVLFPAASASPMEAPTQPQSVRLTKVQREKVRQAFADFAAAQQILHKALCKTLADGGATP